MTLTTNELSGMRAASDGILPDTCTISRVTRSQSTTGAYSESWANLATGVVCRLDSVSESEEKTIRETSGVTVKFALALKYDQDIKEADRVVHSALTYEVVAVEKAHSWLIHRRCYLKRVQA